MRKRPETVQIRLSAEVMDWIDEFRAAQLIRPSRSAVVRYLTERGIATENAGAGELIQKLAQKAAEGLTSPPLAQAALGETAPHGPLERL